MASAAPHSAIRSAKDFWAGVIYIGLGLTAVVIARDYGMGTALRMGPGYFPTVLGFLLTFIGVISVARSFIQPGTPIDRFTFKGLLLVLGSTLLFGLVVRGAGLVIALPLLVLISAYASIHFRWPRTLVLASGLTAFCILVFALGLGVPLPIFGSWFGF
jgi:putative tricarboxylic transport membrane protein